MRPIAIPVAVCILISALACAVFADQPELRCGLVDAGGLLGQGTEANPWTVAHTGSLKTLVIYAKMLDDSTGCCPPLACWNDWLPDDTLPAFGDWFIADQANPDSFPEPSLNDYYWKMSSGQYFLYGDHYPRVVETDEDMWGYGYANINPHILRKIAHDSTFDFSYFDADHNDTLDMVIMVWRNDGRGIARPHIFHDAGGLLPDTILTWDGMSIYCEYGIHCPFAANSRAALSIVAHEHWHKLEHDEDIGGCFHGTQVYHLEKTGKFGVSSGYMSRGMAMSAYERQRLCWLDTIMVISSDVTSLKIPESITDGAAVKIFIRDEPGDSTDEYFLLENRQRNNWYSDEVGYGGCNSHVLPGAGLVIWHVEDSGGSDDFYHKQVDLESASGLFTWDTPTPDAFHGLDGSDSLNINAFVSTGRQDSRDLFNGWWNNSFTPYTNPNSNGYEQAGSQWNQTKHTGISITNIRKLYGTDTMLVDIHFDVPPDTITHDTKWGRWTILGGDVVVADGCQLTINDDAVVNFVPDADCEASGADTARAELIALGDIATQSTESDSIVFRPAGIGRGHTPAPDDWYGLRIEQADTMYTDLGYSNIGYGHLGITYFSSDPPPFNFADSSAVSHCTIHDNGLGGIAYEAPYGFWPRLGTVESNTIEYNGSSAEGYGISISRAGVQVTDNTIRHNTNKGIVIDYTRDAVIRGNTINQNQVSESIDAYGVYFDLHGVSARWATIVDNTIKKCNQAGIYVLNNASHATKVVVDSNWVANCTYGAASYDGTVNDSLLFSWNIFKTDSIGVYCDSLGVVIGDNAKGIGGNNDFRTNNTYFVENDGPDSLKAEGNYWGSAPPEAAKFLGLVDYVPYLNLAPGELFGPKRPESPGNAVLRLQACPNPSSSEIVFALELAQAGHVRLRIFDTQGRLVANLKDAHLARGRHLVPWGDNEHGDNAPGNGVYFCRLDVGDESYTVKVVLMR